MNIFLDEHLEVIGALIDANVEFMLIGGYAVIYYGYKRTTGDMDLWLKPDNNNKERLITALQALNFGEDDIASLKNLDFTQHLTFSLGIAPERIDFLTRVSGIEYEDAEKEKITGIIESKAIPVINLSSLILTKMTDRQKDKADIEALQRIRNSKK